MGEQGLKLKIFLGYLTYRYCDEQEHHHNEYYIFQNSLNNKVASVSERQDVLERETIYHICNDLGIDMPDEFEDFQRMMDSTKPQE